MYEIHYSFIHFICITHGNVHLQLSTIVGDYMLDRTNYQSFLSVQFQTAGIFTWCVKGLLHDRPRQSLLMWMKSIQLCYETEFTWESLTRLKDMVPLACSLMERDWPLSFQVKYCTLTLGYTTQI